MHGVLFLIGVLLVACGGTGGTEPGAAKAETITCTAAYRADVSQGMEREETLTFTDSDSEQSAVFADMAFHAAYSTGELDNERALRLWVTMEGETAVSPSTLYQMPADSGPQNQFVGGHGFTGLHHSYHPDSQAELQFWCAAN